MESDARKEVRRVIDACLAAVEREDWTELARYIHPGATIFVSESDKETAQAWSPDGARDLFGPRSGRTWLFSRPLRHLAIDVLGTNAFVWIDTGRARERDIILTLSDGSWLIRHLHLRLLEARRKAS